ncbi:hypothetical protein [Nonomuraea sediminis]|uniref:hypothetical protein n=1 Tax=Nonomuraea sediminis TaxID=2835864 RepID=UPI001BDD0622|nr:hypothetical protein [Nonomuraea sediminis]
MPSFHTRSVRPCIAQSISPCSDRLISIASRSVPGSTPSPLRVTLSRIVTCGDPLNTRNRSPSTGSRWPAIQVGQQ